MGDFADLIDSSKKRCRDFEKDAGSEREWLKVFETLPAQMLNADGQAQYARMKDEQLWEHLCKPLKSGAAYMTEMASDEAALRGVGMNRWLHAMVAYLEYQQQPEVRMKNDFVIKETKCKELYEEIDRILPSLKYCLARRKQAQKEGASSLWSSAVQSVVSETKSAEELDKHAKILYEWLDSSTVSRIRMLLHWQSAGGMSHVAAVNHRAVVCFRYSPVCPDGRVVY